MTENIKKDNKEVNKDIKQIVLKNNPGYKRKLASNDKLSKAGEQLRNSGPLSLLITYLFDIIVQIIQLIFNMSKSVKSAGSQVVYDFFYTNGAKIIPENIKYGTVISLKPFRVLLNIVFPPLGIFLSRGMYGIHHVIIATILIKFRIIDLPIPILSMCYAFVISHIPSYADRFNKYDFYRLMTIRAMINTCNRSKILNNFRENLPTIIFISVIILFIIIMYISIKFIKTTNKMKK